MRKLILLIFVFAGLKDAGATSSGQSTVFVHPRNQTVEEGQDVVIVCEATGSVSWGRGHDFSRRVFLDGNRLVIYQAELSDSGTYFCISEDGEKIDPAEVSVTRRRKFTGAHYNHRSSTNTSLYRSPFSDSGDPIGRAKAWSTAGLPTTHYPFTSVAPPTNTFYPCMYGICNGTCCKKDFVEDYFDCANGQKINKSLVCNRENDCADGSDESRCSPWPPKITVLPKHEVKVFCGDQEKEKSGTLTLECQSVGHPTPVIRWKKYDGHVPSKCQQYSKRGHGILTCPNFRQSDQGAYSCVAENSVKSAESQPKSVAKCSNRINCSGFRVVSAEGIEHCLKCYCSGKTSLCQSIKSNSKTLHFPFPDSKVEIFAAESGEILFVPTKTELLPSHRIRESAQEITYCTLTESDFEETSFLKSFGRSIIVPTYKGRKNFLSDAPDLIIRGNGLTLMYRVKLISPFQEGLTYTSARFWPGNWHHTNKSAASREDLMKVLSKVDSLFVRCEYTQGSYISWNKTANISLETSVISEFATSVSYVEKCNCPAGYDGLSCESCAAGYKKKSEGNDSTCEKIYVPPPCEEGYLGAQCKSCDLAKGYVKKGERCVKPTCHPEGSVSTSFSPLGNCTCKEGVTGTFCDECKSGYFHLSKGGCLKCWCSGVTSQCVSSHLHRAVISNTPRGGYNSSDGRNFWLLPSDFSGNRLTSYGGHLNYTMKYKPGIAKENTYLTVEFLSVDDVTLTYTHTFVDRSTLRDDKSWSVPIVETNWRKSDRSSVSRGEFLTVLSKIKAIYIESPYHLSSGQVNLTSTRMSFASLAESYKQLFASDSEVGLSVEQCSCPEGYTGLSCESCSDGYYKKRNGTVTQCIKCNCTNCDPEFGCPDCPALTYRDNPETEKMPVCKPCPCNGNGISCVKDDHNQIFCRCKLGFTGMQCESIIPTKSEEFEVSISPRKIRGKRVGTIVSLNCSFSANEEMVLSAEKNFGSQRKNLLTSSLSHSGAVVTQNRTTKTFQVVLEDGLEAIDCFVHDAAGKLAARVVASVEDLTTIIRPVKIKNCYSDRIDVKESEGKDIICEATGSPAPVVNWYKLVNGSFPEKVDTSDGVHAIKSASLKDNGTIYTCIAENSEGDKATCTQVLIVRKKCEVISIFPKVVEVEEKENFSIQCKTTAKSPVHWSVHDAFFNRLRPITSNRMKVRNGYLQISDALVSDSGTYVCTAKGENGEINGTAVVTVKEKKVPPTASIQEYDKVLKAGETFVVTCLGKGKPVPSIHWTKVNGVLDGNVKAIGATLRISKAVTRNTGTYQCEARSILGKATDYISIEVNESSIPPRVNVSEEVVSGQEGSEVTLGCLAIGYPRPRLTWFAPNISFNNISRATDSMVLITPQESIKEEMTLRLSKEMDGLVVTCTGENEAGKSQKEIRIKLSQFSDAVNETLEFVPIGSYFEVICDVPDYAQMTKLGGLVGDECPIPNGVMILSVQSQHNGTYICKTLSGQKKKINLVVVGFVPKFRSSTKSHLVLPMTQRSSHELRVEMSFKPTSENGLLLRKDNSKFGIYLENGIIHLIMYSHGGNFIDFRMKRSIHMGRWSSLAVTIDRKYIDVTVYNERMEIHERKTEDSKNFNISMGHGNDSVFVGGCVEQRRPMELFFKYIPHFDGCISRLTIDHHEYDIVKEGSHSENVTLCRRCFEEKNLCGERGKCFDAPTQYGFICVCPNSQENRARCSNSCVGKGCETQLDLCALLKPCTTAFSFSNKCYNNMYSLQCTCAYGYAGTTCEKVQQYSFCVYGNGFVRLPSDLLERRVGEREVVKMAFTLTKPDGQLLWQGDKSNHLSIAAVDGRLRYAYVNQHSKLLVRTNKIEMNKKHTLLVTRINETVVLELNGPSGPEVYRNESSKYYTNRVTGDIYLGNVPPHTHHAGHVGMHGCIHYVSLGEESKINLPEKELEKLNVSQVSRLFSTSRYFSESEEFDYSNDLDSSNEYGS